jgi:hypothetical protein
VEAVYARTRAAIEAGIQKNGSQARPYAKDGKLTKDIILAMQGSWNCRLVRSCECVESTTRDDAPATVHVERSIGTGLTKFMTQHSTLSNKSMALFSLVSLSTAHLMVCHALALATKIGLRIHGCVVYAVLISGSTQQMQTLKQGVANKLRADGSAMLQVKDTPKKAPSSTVDERVVVRRKSEWRQFVQCKGARRFKGEAFGKWMHDTQFAHTQEWTVLSEPEGIGSCCAMDTFQRQAAEAIVENRVSGRGGVGKTELIRLLVELFTDVGYKDKIEILASTHVQAQCANENTPEPFT